MVRGSTGSVARRPGPMVAGRPSRADLVYGAVVTPNCSHLDLVLEDLPAGLDVCPACVEIGSPWVHLRQCLVCGRTGCCDSSPNRHASTHARQAAHPLMRTLEAGQDWAWCFVDEETLRRPDGAWIAVDPFFDAGLWFVGKRIEQGLSLDIPDDELTSEGFPLGQWATTYRKRHRTGTMNPEQVAALEAVPGWEW